MAEFPVMTTGELASGELYSNGFSGTFCCMGSLSGRWTSIPRAASLASASFPSMVPHSTASFLRGHREAPDAKETEARPERTGGLGSVPESLPQADRLKKEADMHRALADAVEDPALPGAVRLCPCVLKEITRLTDSKHSYHLGVPEGAGLIEPCPMRKWRIYVLTEAGREWMSK